MGIHENTSRKGDAFIYVSHVEGVKEWGVVGGGIHRGVSFNDNRDGETFTLTTSVSHSGETSGLDLKMETRLSLEQLGDIIETLTEIRDAQTRRRQERDKWMLEASRKK